MAYPIIDYKKCTACKTCIDVCPMDVFVEEKGKVIVKKPKECIGCKACEVQCPEKAIEVVD